MKRILSFLSLLLCLTLLSGCSNQVVMSDRLLIRGIGIDSIGERRYRASVHVMKTTEQEDAAELLQVEGESVLDALNNLTLQIGKTPLYSHNLIVIFGRSCAEQGLDYVLDFFQLHSLPLRFVRSPLQTAALLCHLRQNAAVMFHAFLVHPAPQCFLDDPVDLQIRIPADGRSKMTVILSCQPEMSYAFR